MQDIAIPDDNNLFRIAWQCALKILSIPRSKRTNADVEAWADNLLRWCTGCDVDGQHWTPEDQMLWVVQEVHDRFDAPAMPSDVKRMILAKFCPDLIGHTTTPAFEKPEIKCALCSDWGRIESADGLLSYCTCEAGQTEKERSGQEFLDKLNRRRRHLPKPVFALHSSLFDGGPNSLFPGYRNAKKKRSHEEF